MRVIHKAHLELTDYVTAIMPKDSKILAFQEQGGRATIWYMFDNQDVSAEERRFWIVGTGNSITSDQRLEYVATWQFANGFVWHLFEDKRR